MEVLRVLEKLSRGSAQMCLVDVGDGIADGCSVFGAKLFVDELRLSQAKATAFFQSPASSVHR